MATVLSADLNDVPRITGTFRNAAAALADPTAVTVVVTTSAGVATTYTYPTDAQVVKSSTGVYYIDVALSSTGRWTVVWRGTGTVADADEINIIVGVSNGYCSLDELKAELGVSDSDTTDDAKLRASINAASRQIDGWCGRRFWQDSAVVTREFYADSSRTVYVDDISTTTGLIVKTDEAATGAFGTTLTLATDFLLRPANAADSNPVEPYTEIWLADNYSFPLLHNGRPGVQVTAKFGWPAVPDDIAKAALIQAAQLFKAKDAVFGVAGVGEMGVLRVSASLNPLAKGLVAPYRKPAIA